MSLILGFVTGLTAGEVVERKKGRDRFRDYLERRGYSIVDRQGNPIPVEVAISEGLQATDNSKRTIIIAGAMVATAVILTGGTALILLSVV
jgi:hypothetical protein